MKSYSAAHKTTRKTPGRRLRQLSSVEKAMAIAPPAYGIDFADRSTAATPPVQRNQDTTPSRGAVSKSITTTDKANNTGLPDRLKGGIEQLSGFSMDDVRVHYNSSKPSLMNAHAYAQGTEIHVGSGQEEHLPHEAWHVVQQKQGRVRPTMQMKGGMNINHDKRLEKEADVMGARALQQQDAATIPKASLSINQPGRALRVTTQRAAIVQLDQYDNEFATSGEHSASDGEEAEPVKIIPKALEDKMEVAGEETLSSFLQKNSTVETAQFALRGNTDSENTYDVDSDNYTVKYRRGAKGGIDFANPTSAVKNIVGGTLDVKSSWGSNYVKKNSTHDVNIITTVNSKEYIDYILNGKYVYTWANNKKARKKHFKAANVKIGVSGDGQPASGITWHHDESTRGRMVGVKTDVHKRHAHNGGVLLWP